MSDLQPITWFAQLAVQVWFSGPPDFDTQMKLRDHFDTQTKSGGLEVWWFGGLVVWWSGGLVVWWSGLVVSENFISQKNYITKLSV